MNQVSNTALRNCPICGGESYLWNIEEGIKCPNCNLFLKIQRISSEYNPFGITQETLIEEKIKSWNGISRRRVNEK